MNNVYGYIRVSDKKQEQGASLSEQKRILSAYAKAHDLNIIHFYKETKTAAKRGRPFFTEMMKNLKDGKAQGVIIHKIDRSARNLHDWAEIGNLIDNNIQVYFAHENLNLNERGGRLSADIQAVMASDYVRNLRQETIKGQMGRLKEGLYPFGAPLGYVNNGKGKVKTIDPEKGKLIKILFELYASKKYSLRSLSIEMEKRGLRNINGRKVCKNGIFTILQNPFYIGIMSVKNQTFKGKHKPLISTKLFNKVQLIMKYKQNRKVFKHDYLFRKMFKCKICNHTMIGEKQKGRVYYRCHTKNCETKSIREDYVERYVINSLKTIELDKSEVQIFENTFLHNKQKLKSLKQNLRRNLMLQKSNAEAKEEKLLDAYLDNVIDKTTYDKRRKNLLIKIQGLSEEIKSLDESKNTTLEKIEIFLELCKSPINIYKSGIFEEKRELIENITSNLLVDGKKIYFSMLSPYNELGKRDIFLSSVHNQDKHRILTTPLCYISKHTSGIKPKSMNEEEIKQFLDYLSNDAQW